MIHITLFSTLDSPAWQVWSWRGDQVWPGCHHEVLQPKSTQAPPLIFFCSPWAVWTISCEAARFLVRSHQVPEDGPNWQRLERWFSRDLWVNYYKSLGCFLLFLSLLFLPGADFRSSTMIAVWPCSVPATIAEMEGQNTQCQKMLRFWVEFATTRWWVEHIFYFYPLFGKDSHFDYLTFFNWVGSTTN